MFFVLFALCSLSIISGQQNITRKARLNGGTAVAAIADSPFVVYVIAKDNAATPGTQREGVGAIISELYVLTSAYLVVDAYSVTIAHGNTDPTMGTVVTGVAIIHPGYIRNWGEDDIALIKLNTALTFSSTVNKVTLPTAGKYVHTKNLADNTFRVYGFGRATESATLGSMTYLDTTVQDGSTCINSMKLLYYRLATYHSCLDNASGTKGICPGDLGGPLVTSGTSPTIVGVITWFMRCTDVAIFTRVSPYLTWIRKYVSTTANTGK